MAMVSMVCFNHNRRCLIILNRHVDFKQDSAFAVKAYASCREAAQKKRQNWYDFRRLGAGAVHQTPLAFSLYLLPVCHCVDVYKISLMNFSTAREAAVNGCCLDVAIQVVCCTLGLHK